jgi:hypothetical protein
MAQIVHGKAGTNMLVRSLIAMAVLAGMLAGFGQGAYALGKHHPKKNTNPYAYLARKKQKKNSSPYAYLAPKKQKKARRGQ